MTGIDRLRILDGDARELARDILADWITAIDALDHGNPVEEIVIDAILNAVIDMECALK